MKQAISAKNIDIKGYSANKVGSHSLRSGGAMALYISNHSGCHGNPMGQSMDQQCFYGLYPWPTGCGLLRPVSIHGHTYPIYEYGTLGYND